MIPRASPTPSPQISSSPSTKSRTCLRPSTPSSASTASATSSKSSLKSSTSTAISIPASSVRWSAPRKSTISTKNSRPFRKKLGRGEKSEIDELKKKIDAAGMSKEVHEKAIQELKRLELMPPMSAESTVSRNYLDWLLAVPWKKRSKEIRDIKAAEKILNEEH